MCNCSDSGSLEICLCFNKSLLSFPTDVTKTYGPRHWERVWNTFHLILTKVCRQASSIIIGAVITVQLVKPLLSDLPSRILLSHMWDTDGVQGFLLSAWLNLSSSEHLGKKPRMDSYALSLSLFSCCGFSFKVAGNKYVKILKDYLFERITEKDLSYTCLPHRKCQCSPMPRPGQSWSRGLPSGFLCRCNSTSSWNIHCFSQASGKEVD